MNYIGIIKRQSTIIFCSVILLTITIIGISYATVFRVNSTSATHEVKAGTLSINYSNTGGAISADFYPLDDDEGKETDPYSFTVTNNGTLPASYSVLIYHKALEGNVTYVPHSLLRTNIDNGTVSTLSSLSTYNTTNVETDKQYILYTGTLAANETITHNIRVWLSDTATSEVSGKTVSLQVKVVTTVADCDEEMLASEYITRCVNKSEIAYDDTEDHNLRYVGATPNNYVKFNNELWRVIGVMNNVDGGTVSGDDATRVKIIRAESLGKFPYYDSCADENWIDNGDGTYSCSNLRYNNNWPNSTANEILTTYYNNGTHAAYHGLMPKTGIWVDYPTAAIDFTSNGLNSISKNLIENATYYLGGYDVDDNTSNYYYYYMTTAKWYEAERTNSGSNNNLIWTGNLGLMYPSDYGYATSGTVSENSCKNIALDIWYQNDYVNCINNDWLLINNWYQWTITPRIDNNGYVAIVYNNGRIFTANATNHSFMIRPVAYLKSTVKIAGGEGTTTNPYRLEID
ncbi:MAG: hypothetical protein IJ574_04085 [Bacilli bacterium]|nr:hypothetical protein [Bacilli bacterium]